MHFCCSSLSSSNFLLRFKEMNSEIFILNAVNLSKIVNIVFWSFVLDCQLQCLCRVINQILVTEQLWTASSDVVSSFKIEEPIVQTLSWVINSVLGAAIPKTWKRACTCDFIWVPYHRNRPWLLVYALKMSKITTKI